MKLHATFALLLALAFAAPASANYDDRTVAERADAQAEKIATDTEKYLDELDASIALARDGGYGKLPRGSGERLTELRARIGELLKGGVDPRSLPPEQRIELFNAHQEIAAIIKKDDKDRLVCTREAATGTRVTRTECMTVGEREERARMAQRGTESMQRNTCTPGEGQSCSK